jgi:hypothetical protein
MRRMRWLGQSSGLLVASAVVAVTAAGCGTAGPSVTAGTKPASAPTRPARSRPIPGPPSGSRALAERTARWLLRDLVMPPGSRRDRSRPLPADIRHAQEVSGSGHMLLGDEIFAVGRPAAWVLDYLRRHVPAGLTTNGSGSSGALQFLSWSPRHLPAGLYQAELTLSVIPGGPGALVRADTQVIWYPPRSRAEYVIPARFAAVRLREHLLDPHPHTVRLTVTAPAVIARLARTVDVLQADPGVQYGCPAIMADGEVTFVPKAAAQPQIVAVPDGCNSVGMWVGAKQQPELTGGWATIMLMNRLLGLTRTGVPARK